MYIYFALTKTITKKGTLESACSIERDEKISSHEDYNNFLECLKSNALNTSSLNESEVIKFIPINISLLN